MLMTVLMRWLSWTDARARKKTTNRPQARDGFVVLLQRVRIKEAEHGARQKRLTPVGRTANLICVHARCRIDSLASFLEKTCLGLRTLVSPGRNPPRYE
jgi:hypothetical protein